MTVVMGGTYTDVALDDHELVLAVTTVAWRARLADAIAAAAHRGFAFVSLVVLVPVLVAIAMAVKLSSPGPVLYRQTRVGHRGREFTMYKFRTMVLDADARREALKKLHQHNGALFKIRHDPRVTQAGAWLRRFSLDELPQLWNVVRGEMALVGPRPALPEEVALYDHVERTRLYVSPGLTGLWQVSGRADLTWEDSVRLDVEYVETRSLALDVKLLARTVGAVLRGNGAY